MSHFIYESTGQTLDFERRDGLTHIVSETPLDVRLGMYDQSRDEPNGMNISFTLDEQFSVAVPFNNLIPVYYSESPVVVGTSLEEVAQLAGKTAVRAEAVSQMRLIGHVFGDGTRFEGVKRLGAGERLTVRDGAILLDTWDELPQSTPQLRDDFVDSWMTALRNAVNVPMQAVNIPFAGSALDVLLTKLYLEAGKNVTLHVPDMGGNEARVARDLFDDIELAETAAPEATLALSLSKRIAASYEATDGNLTAYESIPTGRAVDLDYVEVGKHGTDWLYGKHVFLKDNMDEHEAKQQLSRKAIRAFEGFGEAEREQVEGMLDRLFDAEPERDWNGRLEAVWFHLKIEHFHAYARRGFMGEMTLLQPLFDRDVLRHILEAPYELRRQGHLVKVALEELFGTKPLHFVKETFAWSDAPLLPTVVQTPLNWRLMLEATASTQVKRMNELLGVESGVTEAFQPSETPDHGYVSLWNDWTAKNWSARLSGSEIEPETVELMIPEAHKPRSVTIKPFIYHYFIPFNAELFNMREEGFATHIEVKPLGGENGYVQLFNQSFSAPPSTEFQKDATLGSAPYINIEGTIELVSDETTPIELYVMQYDAKKNLKKTAFSHELRPGANTLRHRLPKEVEAKFVKLAIKFQNNQHTVQVRMGSWVIES
ncbi:hypothetical protein [Exiguobacterium sp. SH0S2]|uniref:hypothetical protein n=1 Tax=Exiguobacterium sp. SH0S2 TaxID=2510950 RepID=UPI00103AF643|nr:hypothetical protein [Exiguobacterium sp. SH0S2]TCI63057.1 hypothetical protein EVJ21_05955 [Exiguobacterium sp. SH0S2]